MGLLYYGQNFLIYPSAFPAGARESEFPYYPLALSVLIGVFPPSWGSLLMARCPGAIRIFNSIHGP